MQHWVPRFHNQDSKQSMLKKKMSIKGYERPTQQTEVVDKYKYTTIKVFAIQLGKQGFFMHQCPPEARSRNLKAHPLICTFLLNYGVKIQKWTQMDPLNNFQFGGILQ